MVAAIQTGDESARHVYGDYLESKGRILEAEYLRAELAVQAAVGIEETKAALAQFSLDAWRVCPEFKALVSRPAVENCRFELKCPLKWASLRQTADPKVRSCDACQKPVTFCANVHQARTLALEGHCVAIDVSQRRTADDLSHEEGLMMGRIAR